MLLARLAMSAFEDMPASPRDARSHMDAASSRKRASRAVRRGAGRSAFATPCARHSIGSRSRSCRRSTWSASSSMHRSRRTRVWTARKKYPYRADRRYTRARLVASASASAAAAPSALLAELLDGARRRGGVRHDRLQVLVQERLRALREHLALKPPRLLGEAATATPRAGVAGAGRRGDGALERAHHAARAERVPAVPARAHRWQRVRAVVARVHHQRHAAGVELVHHREVERVAHLALARLGRRRRRRRRQLSRQRGVLRQRAPRLVAFQTLHLEVLGVERVRVGVGTEAGDETHVPLDIRHMTFGSFCRRRLFVEGPSALLARRPGPPPGERGVHHFGREAPKLRYQTCRRASPARE